VRIVKMIRPSYAEKFHCIGPACEDDCCTGWRVTVDKAAYERYQGLTESPLRPLFESKIALVPEGTKGQSIEAFAIIQMTPQGPCSFLSAERLCRIQIEHGSEALCNTCAIFPRTPRQIDGLPEGALSLSCPEAARLILLDPDLGKPPSDCKQFYWDDKAKPAASLRSYFWHIREFTIGLIRNRNYPLWQRIFLLGTFSRRLDALAHGELHRDFPAFLLDFSAAIAAGSLRASMDTIPADHNLQLDILISLINLRVGKAGIAPRLHKILHAFGQGIGHLPGASPQSQIERYIHAYQNYAAPFFQKYPHFLENFLINEVHRTLFPFDNNLFVLGTTPEPARAFARLATHFALMKGLLIGVAGFHKEEFTPEIAIEAVQSAYRHFEHNAEFLDLSHQLLVTRKMDNAHGLTMLLRN